MAKKKQRKSSTSFGTGASIDPTISKAVQRQKTFLDKELDRMDAHYKGKKPKWYDLNSEGRRVDVTEEMTRVTGPYLMEKQKSSTKGSQ